MFKKQWFALVILSLLSSSCRTLGSFPSVIPINTIPSDQSIVQPRSLTEEDILFKENIRYVEETEVKDCHKLFDFSHHADNSNEGTRILNNEAAKRRSDSIVVTKEEHGFFSHDLEASLYRCHAEKTNFEKMKSDKFEKHKYFEMDIFMGSYISRHGILRELGAGRFSLGLELTDFNILANASFQKNDLYAHHGLFMLWTFDHFLDSNYKILKPEFFDQDYTNYMLAFGYAFRTYLHPRWQLNYRGGFAINFIEVDTFRKNGDNNDSKYTDITISTVHKLGLDYLVKKSSSETIFKQTPIRIGLSLLYYFAPDPLGKFGKTDELKIGSSGGSTAWYLDFKFEFY